MTSPYNYTLSSIVLNHQNDTDNESEADGNDFLNDDFENDSVSELLPPTEMDINSDLDDVSSEILDDDVLSIVEETEGNSMQVNSRQIEFSAQVDVSSEENSMQFLDTEVNDEEILQEPELKRARLEKNEQSDDTESVDPNQKCPICLAAWTNVGEHRLCSLRCGHLFGLECIKQWLTSNAKKCPQCNSRASVRHIRLIYGNKLSCLDTRQIEKMKRQLEESNMKLSKISKALAKQKRKTTKYKQMYQAHRTLALTVDSDFSLSD